VSAFGNVAYTYNDKYSFTGSFRVDQKNLFGSDPDFRYKPLWSVGAGWQLSREDFMSDIDWINRLNVRATYGINGNASNKYSPYAQAVNDIRAYGNNIYDNLRLVRPANDRLRWEETAVTNFAVDFSFLNSRVNGSIDYYIKNSSDLLGGRDLDPTNGFARSVINYASMQNKGVELMLNLRVMKTKDFSWDVNVNFSYNKNEVTKVDNEINTPRKVAEKGILKKGQPLNNLYSFNYAGLSDGGEVMLYDLDGNTKSWREDVESTGELLYHGTSVAPYYGGLSTTVRYKAFDLTLNTTFKAGYKFSYNYGMGSDVEMRRMNEVWANRWQKPGDEKNTRVPKLAYDGLNPHTGNSESYLDSNDADLFWMNSQDMVHSGTFIKAKEIVLAYTMPQNILRNTPVNSLRMSVQVNNPFMWVENKHGIDPENAYGAAWTNLKGVIFGLKASF
jgi:hypothetical protein